MADPVPTPVTRPAASTVATVVVALLQLPPVPVVVSKVVAPTQMPETPDITPANGEATATTVLVTVSERQLEVSMYVTVAVPVENAVPRPEDVPTVTTDGLLLDQDPPDVPE